MAQVADTIAHPFRDPTAKAALYEGAKAAHHKDVLAIVLGAGCFRRSRGGAMKTAAWVR